MMVIGRIIFGIASENLIIAQAIITGIWFKGKELGTAMGIIICLPEIGSALNSFLTPFLYSKSGNLTLPLFMGVFFCIFSFLCGLGLIYLDKYAEN